MKQKLSIVTINYNDLNGLKKTVNSVLSQTNRNFEWIIIDGASTDGSKEYLDSLQEQFSFYVSEKDSGIFNALNKGVRCATCDYLLFLNSGDALYSSDTVEQILKVDFDKDLITGSAQYETDKPVLINRPRKTLSLFSLVNLHKSDPNKLTSCCICWPATIFRRQLLLDTPYDENYRVAADYKFWLEQIIYRNCTYKPMDVLVSRFDLSGVSNRPNNDSPTILNEMLPERIYHDYVIFCQLKKNIFFRIFYKIYRICLKPKYTL